MSVIKGSELDEYKKIAQEESKMANQQKAIGRCIHGNPGYRVEPYLSPYSLWAGQGGG